MGIQIIITTKGAVRIAEIAARFTLDSISVKMMAIEAEYNSGAITEDEAAARKNDIQREVDFFGSMDGATKFIFGNDKVRLIIIGISIIGGILIGVIDRGETTGDAIRTYIPLSIANGFFTTVQALILALAVSIGITREALGRHG
jgi:flagellar biosynthesis protein FlhA